MSNAKIVYLVQGRASEIEKVRKIFSQKCVIYLTWDYQVDGCIYYPQSTWSEGRRRLFDEVKNKNYEYIGYVDADFEILRGSLEGFESKISKYKPAIAVPVVDKNRHLYQKFKNFSVGLIFNPDEQFQVYSRKILFDCFEDNPFISTYDDLSWWYPCVINQAIVQRYLWRSTFVDLELEISNGHSEGYVNNYSPDFIHKQLKDHGVGWYFPFNANRKRELRNRYFGNFFEVLDHLVLMVSVQLFRFIYKNLDQTKLEVPREVKLFFTKDRSSGERTLESSSEVKVTDKI